MLTSLVSSEFIQRLFLFWNNITAKCHDTEQCRLPLPQKKHCSSSSVACFMSFAISLKLCLACKLLDAALADLFHQGSTCVQPGLEANIKCSELGLCSTISFINMLYLRLLIGADMKWKNTKALANRISSIWSCDLWPVVAIITWEERALIKWDIRNTVLGPWIRESKAL